MIIEDRHSSGLPETVLDAYYQSILNGGGGTSPGRTSVAPPLPAVGVGPETQPQAPGAWPGQGLHPDAAATGAAGAVAPGGLSDPAASAWTALALKYPGLNITSKYRDPATNTRVGGASGSQHLHGNAIDFVSPGWTREQEIQFLNAAQQAGFRGFGMYGNNKYHVDVGGPRVWGSSYKRDTAPQWAINALGY